MQHYAVFHTLTEVCSTGVLVVNGHGFIESISPAAASYFGFHCTDLIGANLLLLMPSLAEREVAERRQMV